MRSRVDFPDPFYKIINHQLATDVNIRTGPARAYTLPFSNRI